jgi:DNA helicase HerA-like ATPase
MKARGGKFQSKPVVVIVDEAHNFLGRKIGSDDYAARLDAFELIAKEGRKYGLNICLATQRPRDITEGVLSQMGTLIVHRLTNDRDREVVERACGEIDRSASAFLPNLRPGDHWRGFSDPIDNQNSRARNEAQVGWAELPIQMVWTIWDARLLGKTHAKSARSGRVEA